MSNVPQKVLVVITAATTVEAITVAAIIVTHRHRVDNVFFVRLLSLAGSVATALIVAWAGIYGDRRGD